MKHIVLIIAAFAWACDNQTARYQSPADDLFGPDEDSLLAEEPPDTDTEGDKWWEDAPNTLPDTTVATCGNGVIDEGEECDYTAEGYSATPCQYIDPEIFNSHANAGCDEKWCIHRREGCLMADKPFDCPIGYAGESCDKCSALYQDLDGNGTCEESCAGSGSGFMHNGIFVDCGPGTSNGHGCEYYKGKPVCSCMEGWKRDENGSCTINA